jgi:hypothetical protein
MSNICFDKVMLICVVIVALGLISFQYYIHQKELEHAKTQKCPLVCPTAATPVTTSPVSPIIIKEQPEPRNIVVDVKQTDTVVGNPLRDYDYRALSDPLVPPLKRDDYNISVLPPIPTRGYPTAYKKMGLLLDPEAENTDPYKFLILVGRQKHTGSNVYDYYVTENKPDSALKFDLPNVRKELSTDDTLRIDELGKTYNVKIDRSLGFDYNPFLY